MKKMLLLVLCLSLFFSVSLAESYESLSDEELLSRYSAIRAEIAKRMILFREDALLAKEGGVTIRLTGGYELQAGDLGEPVLRLEMTIANGADRELTVVPAAAINGTDVGSYLGITVGAGETATEFLEFNMADAGLSAFEEISEMQFIFTMLDEDFETYCETASPVRVVFGI